MLISMELAIKETKYCKICSTFLCGETVVAPGKDTVIA